MLFSIALILMVGLGAGWTCKKIHLPGLLGMIVAGIVLGPYGLNVLDRSLLDISGELRRIALIIILIRAGLSLDLRDLRKVGRPALLMCFLPASMEMLGILLLAPPLLGISLLDAAIVGAVAGAVSPAVIVPRMLKLMEEGYGVNKGIPQLILAGASVDDVFVIVMFSTFTGLAEGGEFSPVGFMEIPISIVLGIVFGLFFGLLLGKVFEKIHIRDTIKVILLLCISFLFVTLEDSFCWLPFSGLIAVMCSGIALRQKRETVAKHLSYKFNKIWIIAEVFLFVLVGTTVNLQYAKQAGISALILILGGLIFRMVGVLLCLIKTNLCKKERLFCVLAYCPKATVQAAIGGIPLSMGLSCGNIVLTVAVLAIMITAPLGALAIDGTYRKWLR